MTGADDSLSEPDLNSVHEVTVLDLRHRLKNVYAVVSGVLSLSARGEPAMRPFVTELRDRIAALEAAHTYLADAPAAITERTVLRFLRVLTAPFDSEDHDTFVIRGQDAAITERAGVPLALIVRELTTNAIKYGALSCEGGLVKIDCEQERGGYRIRWRETGGPRTVAPLAKTGLGVRLIDRAAALAGFSVERQWRAEGLEAVIVIPPEELSR